MNSFLTTLPQSLSPSSQIHLPPSPSFTNLCSRWSDQDLKTPAAIIQPATEDDILQTVRLAVQHKIPFVPTTGGHSPWSTIGEEGVVIDLGLFKEVQVIEDGTGTLSLVRVKGGVLMEELQRELHKYQRFAVVGNGSTVGVIPFYINGGVSTYTPLIGYGCENIVSARVITGNGNLISVSEDENSELYWGIRGAGQFLGLVTEVVVKTYPFSVLNTGTCSSDENTETENDGGVRVRGVHIFPVEQIDQVCAAIQMVTQTTKYMAVGQLMIAQAPPDLTKQVLLVSSQLFCSQSAAQEVLRPLTALGPIKEELVLASFEKHSQHLDWTCVKGGLKRYIQVAVREGGEDLGKFKGLLGLHAELVKECPDARRSTYGMDWRTGKVLGREEEEVDTAFGKEGVRAWFNVLSWYSDPAHDEYVERMEARAVQTMRVGVAEDEWLSYSNTTRAEPIEFRYKGQDRIRKLRELKAKFDPTGQFTQQLL